jgi:apolipoprotein N-acyltransferase
LVPLLWVVAEIPSVGQLLRVGYLFGFCFHGVANWWVSSWQAEADPYLLVAGLALWLGHPLFFLLPLVGSWWIGRRLGASWAVRVFPLLWTSFEWLHSLGELGYPWLLLGYTQALNLRWIQVADLAGIWGATFLVAWANVALVELLRLWVRRGGKLRDWLREPGVVGWAVVCGVAVGFPLLYGSLRLEQVRALPVERTLRAVLVQPNLNPWRKWEGGAEEQVAFQQRLADSVLQDFAAELVVWNETAVPVPVTLPEYRHLWESLRQWVQRRGVSLLSGFAELQLYKAREAPPLARPLPWDSSRAYEAYNAAFLLTPEGRLEGVHRKIRLTPFAERFPYAEFVGALSRLVEWGVGISAWAKGREQRLLRVPHRGESVHVGVAICIESIFPDFIRAYAQAGCDAVVVISNDAWFDRTPGPAQHFTLARVRAIEVRRPLLRCANSGVTAAVLSTGEVIAELPQYRAAALAVVLPLAQGTSLYVRIGELLPQMLTLASFLFLAAAAFGKSFQRQKL